MLYHGREIEMTLFRIIPLKDANTAMLASETKKLVKANAIGIPLISIIQGLVATWDIFCSELMNSHYGDSSPVYLRSFRLLVQW
jgi:hypothetical protein